MVNNQVLNDALVKMKQVADVFGSQGKTVPVRFVVLYDPTEVAELEQTGAVSSMADLDDLTIKNCNDLINQLKNELGVAAETFVFYIETRIDSVSGNGSGLFIFIDYFLARQGGTK